MAVSRWSFLIFYMNRLNALTCTAYKRARLVGQAVTYMIGAEWAWYETARLGAHVGSRGWAEPPAAASTAASSWALSATTVACVSWRRHADGLGGRALACRRRPYLGVASGSILALGELLSFSRARYLPEVHRKRGCSELRIALYTPRHALCGSCSRPQATVSAARRVRMRERGSVFTTRCSSRSRHLEVGEAITSSEPTRGDRNLFDVVPRFGGSALSNARGSPAARDALVGER